MGVASHEGQPGAAKTGRKRGKLLSTSIDIRTVDGDGNALAQGEAILANKGRVLAQRVSLLVLSRDLASLNEGDVEVEVVGLGDSLDGGGTGLVLRHDKSEQPVIKRDVIRMRVRD